jgi:hypothetical protein
VTEYSNPEWATPCVRFMDYMFQVWGLHDLTQRSIRVSTHMPSMIDTLISTDNFSENEKTVNKANLRRNERAAHLAKSEIENDFPFLNSHSLMGICGAMEGMVEDLAVSWIQHNPSVLDEPKLAKIRLPLIEFQRMSDQDRLRFLVTELQRDLGLELKNGATKFESLLTVLGLGGSVDRKVRDTIFEAQNLRNIFAHRGGVADRKLVANCPQLQYNVGDIVKIDTENFVRIFFGLFTYGAVILNRCRTIEG